MHINYQRATLALTLAAAAAACGGAGEGGADTRYTGAGSESAGEDEYDSESGDAGGAHSGEQGDAEGESSTTGEGDGDGDASSTGEGDGDGDGDGDGEGDSSSTGEDDSSTTGNGEVHDCAEISETTNCEEIPVDIIFVVDNSGSMEEEAGFVQDEMNDFSAQIEMTGLDYRVVLISSYPDNGHGICIEPPLGGGDCPDDDNALPVYRHVDLQIGSNNALQLLLQTHPQWEDSIRPDSIKHVVVVSDDESQLDADPFHSDFHDLDPSYDPYVMHAIVCPWMCDEAASIGNVYMDLVDQTGGVLGDLCEQDFQTVFDELADAVIQGVPLSCEFDIPPPPVGMTFDYDLVKVEIDDGNGSDEDIPRVDGPEACMNNPEGWYFDQPLDPKQVVLCPQTCSKIQSCDVGSVNVNFDCESIVPQ